MLRGSNECLAFEMEVEFFQICNGDEVNIFDQRGLSKIFNRDKEAFDFGSLGGFGKIDNTTDGAEFAT